MLVGCYWCISILIIVGVVRWCSLIGPYKLAVVLFDCGYPSFRNVNCIIPINVVGMKSYMDSLFDPTCVPVGVVINKLNLAPNRNVPCFVSILQNWNLCSGIGNLFCFSSIHDHADAHCFLKVLDGRLKETQFAWPSKSEPEKPLEPTGSRLYKTNEVNYINGMSKGRGRSTSMLTLNPLHPNISIHILHNFLLVLTRRICLTIKSFFSWWPFLLFSTP